jgi:hypothetical protein
MRMLLAALPLVGLGCGSIECCMDGGSNAVIEAFVLDAQSAVVPGVFVEATGQEAPCGAEGVAGLVYGGGGTDAAGWVRLQVQAILSSAGLYCVDLIVANPAGAVPDTVGHFEVTFFEGVPSDTARVLVRTSF